jgi:hypothetical protein
VLHKDPRNEKVVAQELSGEAVFITVPGERTRQNVGVASTFEGDRNAANKGIDGENDQQAPTERQMIHRRRLAAAPWITLSKLSL